MKMTFNIPEGMHDISIGKYRQLQTILEKETSATMQVAMVVACLCDVDAVHVLGLDQKSFKQLEQDLQWAINPTKEDYRLVPVVHIDGREYGFIPDLRDLSVGEFADLDRLVSGGNAYNHLEEVMAILYRPVTRRVFDKFYDIEAYDPKPHDKEIMSLMPMSVALGAVVFFWTIAEELASSSSRYSQARNQGRATLNPSGDGTTPSTDSQAGTTSA